MAWIKYKNMLINADNIESIVLDNGFSNGIKLLDVRGGYIYLDYSSKEEARDMFEILDSQLPVHRYIDITPREEGKNE